MKTLGFFGFGSFGQFIAKHLAPFFKIHVYDVADREKEARQAGVEFGSFYKAAISEIVVFAVPLSCLKHVLSDAAGYMQHRSALVLDVCSVKVRPVELMLELLPPTVEIIGTHPLFGPQSGKYGIRGLRIAICPVRSTRLQLVENFLSRELGLVTLRCTPDCHDREMALVQGLTHFVARAANELGIADSNLATKAFEHFVSMTEILGGDSWELFKTIELDNPFATETRHKFLENLHDLERRLKGE